AGATVMLRSEQTDSTLNVRTQSAPDGRFEFFGVREGALSLIARAPSYLDSDAITFELRGASARHSIDIDLTRGEPRAIRVVDAHDAPIAGATLMTACDGHLKSSAVTNKDGSATVAVPRGASCAVYVLPEEGSIAVQQFSGSEQLLIRVPEGSSSLRLAVKSVAGEPFPDLILLMRIDGAVVPPAIARLLGSRGFLLMTNDEGSVSLPRIPAGTYEFWPYRTTAEGQMLYESALEFAAPISLTVLPGENNATVRLKAR
ncbi:MAG TPA: carboxypeptidase-like regulatory domain-containing protein, partial [Thermoanaerobaculia bacterium]|nr:carboxypeptidase-like regulatory domain-containing protein [Thermoanaerobaculia bacterium]